MTPTERAELKALVDEAVRARLAPLQEALAGSVFCSKCKSDLDAWTPGCGTCGDRWRNWRKRGEVSEWAFLHARRGVEAWILHQNVTRTTGRNMNLLGRQPRVTWAESRANFGLTRVLPRR